MNIEVQRQPQGYQLTFRTRHSERWDKVAEIALSDGEAAELRAKLSPQLQRYRRVSPAKWQPHR